MFFNGFFINLRKGLLLNIKQSTTRDVVTRVPLDQMASVAVCQYTRHEFDI